ncbi:MAG: hypothetical protein GTN70_01235 [Deltaproteobacteria bacterium]|nr:hypothetical protein [Deltaproteobacteria bacterium]NIS76275.1 hypothetical protein [Deltaproteobacteria bacterium]
MDNRFVGVVSVSLLLTALTLSGCGRSAPTRYYILSSLKDASQPKAETKTGSDIAIGIGPVKVPGYLNRPQIVSRGGQNELVVAKFDRWGGALQEDVAGVIAENLSLLLPTDKVYVYPWMPNIPLDFAVTVDITRLDGVLGGDVVLHARWVVTGVDWKEVFEKRSGRYIESAGGAGYGDFVAAQSRLLGKLSEDIAASIRDASSR